MKVTELIDILYKCFPKADVKVGLIDDMCCNDYVKSVVEVTDKLKDEVTLYLLHD
jgi:hypothetical protein